jgi:hypothetical protein
MAAAVKEVAKKIGQKALRGEISDMVGIPAPSYIHHHTSHLNLQ